MAGIKNNSLKLKKNTFTTVTTFSKIAALIIFIVLPFAGFYLGFKYGESLNILTVLPSANPSTIGINVTDTIDDALNNRLLLSKTIEGGKISAYRLSEKNPDVFTITLEAGSGYYPSIYSISNVSFSEDSLFEIDKDNTLLVVNGQTNKIDVYSYVVEKKLNKAVVELSSLLYKESINLPKDNVGKIYSIKCTEETCVISTAFNQQSGCSMDLNLITKKYSNIKCSNMRGSFEP